MEIFLVDTKCTGPTRPLVEYFLGQTDDIKYREKIDNELTTAVNNCITGLLTPAPDTFFKAMKQVAEIQLQYFKPMIADGFTDIWKSGLDSGLFTLKLCGSGGGGYLLGFTMDRRRTSEFFRKHGISPLFVIDDLI